MLDDSRIERYSRQIILPDVGGQGQERLLRGRVALVGGQELAYLVATYLAGAGIGHLDWSPSTGHEPDEVQRLAAELADINPDCVARLRALEDLDRVDVIVTAAPVAELQRANAAAMQLGARLIAGNVDARGGWGGHFAGQLDDQPCLDCAAPWSMLERAELDESAVAPVTGVLATLQALEAIKVLLGNGTARPGLLWLYTPASMAPELRTMTKRRGCRTCSR